MTEGLTIAQIGLSVVAGSLTTLSPCVFPLLPLVLGGVTQSSRWSPLAMGAGMVASFAAIGLVLGMAGTALGIDGDQVRMLGGGLLVALAIIMLVPILDQRFVTLMSPISSSANSVATRVDGRSLPGAFGLGALLGIVWSPCSGPLLASALTLVASEGGAGRGTVILGMFGIGAAIPLMMVAYASRAGFTRTREKVLARIGSLKKAFAVLIGLTGLAILTGMDKNLEALIANQLPDWWIQLTTGI